MQSRKFLEYLENLAERLGIEIVYEKLAENDFSAIGGLCKIKNTYKIFMDKSEPMESRIKILTKSLSQFDIDEVYLLPYIREALKKAQEKERASETNYALEK